jgi:hypothetical protein
MSVMARLLEMREIVERSKDRALTDEERARLCALTKQLFTFDVVVLINAFDRTIDHLGVQLIEINTGAERVAVRNAHLADENAKLTGDQGKVQGKVKP